MKRLCVSSSCAISQVTAYLNHFGQDSIAINGEWFPVCLHQELCLISEMAGLNSCLFSGPKFPNQLCFHTSLADFLYVFMSSLVQFMHVSVQWKCDGWISSGSICCTWPQHPFQHLVACFGTGSNPTGQTTPNLWLLKHHIFFCSFEV